MWGVERYMRIWAVCVYNCISLSLSIFARNNFERIENSAFFAPTLHPLRLIAWPPNVFLSTRRIMRCEEVSRDEPLVSTTPIRKSRERRNPLQKKILQYCTTFPQAQGHLRQGPTFNSPFSQSQYIILYIQITILRKLYY